MPQPERQRPAQMDLEMQSSWQFGSVAVKKQQWNRLLRLGAECASVRAQMQTSDRLLNSNRRFCCASGAAFSCSLHSALSLSLPQPCSTAFASEALHLQLLLLSQWRTSRIARR